MYELKVSLCTDDDFGCGYQHEHLQRDYDGTDYYLRLCWGR